MRKQSVAVPVGICACGCGQKTTVARESSTEKGWVKGQPIRFVNGHNGRKHPPETRYREAMKLSFYTGKRIQEHVRIAENALGHALPLRAKVHHVNSKRGDNSKGNLVICQDHAYHQLLHARMRAYKVCGNPNWRPCQYCARHDALDNLIPHERSYYHRRCNADHAREYYQRSKETAAIITGPLQPVA